MPHAEPLTADDYARIHEIATRVPGWSDARHYAFFKQLVPQLKRLARARAQPGEEVRPRLLMLGVYHGRDLAFLLDLAHRYHFGRLDLTGVDKFSDTPCADWPADKHALSWHAAGFGEAPSLDRAAFHLERMRHGATLHLVREPDQQYLDQVRGTTFDAVYLDTAHDYETVARQLRQVVKVCHEHTILCGDDYSDEGTWGVRRAVSEAFDRHSLHAGWIWQASFSDLKNQSALPRGL